MASSGNPSGNPPGNPHPNPHQNPDHKNCGRISAGDQNYSTHFRTILDQFWGTNFAKLPSHFGWLFEPSILESFLVVILSLFLNSFWLPFGTFILSSFWEPIWSPFCMRFWRTFWRCLLAWIWSSFWIRSRRKFRRWFGRWVWNAFGAWFELDSDCMPISCRISLKTVCVNPDVHALPTGSRAFGSDCLGPALPSLQTPCKSNGQLRRPSNSMTEGSWSWSWVGVLAGPLSQTVWKYFFEGFFEEYVEESTEESVAKSVE